MLGSKFSEYLFRLSLGVVLMYPSVSWSQGTVLDPSRVGREIQGVDPTTPRRDVAVPKTRPGFTIDPAIAGRSITVRKVVLEGVTGFQAADLQDLFSGVVNKTVTLGDLGQAIDSISRKYEEAGYVFYNVLLPNQDFADGTVRIVVVEGYISTIEFAGPQASAGVTGRIGGILGNLRDKRPVRRSALERYLLIANEIPGVKIDADVQPDGSGKLGALKLIVQPKITYLQGIGQIDNYQNVPGNGLNFRLGAIANSVLGWGESTEARWLFATPWKTLHLFDFRHSEPITDEGDRFDAIVQYVQQRPKTVFNGTRIDFRGESFYARIQYRYPVIRAVAENMTAFAALDYVNVNYKIEGFHLPGDSLRVARVGVVYATKDSLDGILNATAQASIGLDVFDARAKGRLKANAGFQKFTLNVERTQPLFGNPDFNLVTKATGQVATGTVPNAEVFGFGGRDYGRPFTTLETVGDHGFAVSGEIRWRAPIDFIPREWLDHYFYAFADYGRLWVSSRVNKPFFNQGASAGGGIRIKIFDRFSGEIEAAKPLAGRVSNQGGSQRNWEVFVRLGASF
ncbi:ShlB/FhaC/HecB family hemolysin secretion/activation protein [Reyranella sp. CPCC 100927]|nr:ShlB/FhaC/HecB family hemolysin secretion/activation protein [Reyranella sp. CPCC 100927]